MLLNVAYSQLPEGLSISFPLPLQHRRWQPPITFKPSSHFNLLKVAARLGPGFPRVVLHGQRLNKLKADYRARFCNPFDPLFPKLIEIRNKREIRAPAVGSYLEIEDMVGCIVKEVGSFKDLKAWHRFPCKGKGGVSIGPDENIHEIAGLSEADFNAGNIWWAVLEFPF